MEVAAIGYDENPVRNIPKHDWVHILYMITSAVCLFIEVYQRISVNLFYASYTYKYVHVPSLNRYPTEFTASSTSISCIWYVVYIWQIICLIYSFVGIFRRTPSGSYFYQYPCAMNRSAFFYTASALLMHLPLLLSATNNTYYALVVLFRYITSFYLVFFVFIIVHTTLQDNMRDYLRNRYFLDVWLARIFYQNGLAIWMAILFYESCLAITIGLIYISEISPSSACAIGNIIFLLGLIAMFIYESFPHRDSLAFVLSHWFIFYLLLWDIQYSIKKNFLLSFYNITFVPLTYYVILFFAAWRLMLFYMYCKEKRLPSFHSGRIYTLIHPPRSAF